jgi:serine/threonine protein kinase
MSLLAKLTSVPNPILFRQSPTASLAVTGPDRSLLTSDLLTEAAAMDFLNAIARNRSFNPRLTLFAAPPNERDRPKPPDRVMEEPPATVNVISLYDTTADQPPPLPFKPFTVRGPSGTTYVAFKPLCLDAGNQGKTYLARKEGEGENSQLYVLKIMDANEEEKYKAIGKRVRAVKALKHDHIVSDEDAFPQYNSKNEREVVIVTKYLGESVAGAIERGERFTEEDAYDFFQQVWGALTYAHKRGVIHRDIKASNIIMTILPNGRKHYTIIDFGVAKLVGGSVSGDFVGSPITMPPEQVGGHVYNASDLYSLALIVAEMAVAREWKEFYVYTPAKKVFGEWRQRSHLSSEFWDDLAPMVHHNHRKRKIRGKFRDNEKTPIPLESRALGKSLIKGINSIDPKPSLVSDVAGDVLVDLVTLKLPAGILLYTVAAPVFVMMASIPVGMIAMVIDFLLGTHLAPESWIGGILLYYGAIFYGNYIHKNQKELLYDKKSGTFKLDSNGKMEKHLHLIRSWVNTSMEAKSYGTSSDGDHFVLMNGVSPRNVQIRKEGERFVVDFEVDLKDKPVTISIPAALKEEAEAVQFKLMSEESIFIFGKVTEATEKVEAQLWGPSIKKGQKSEDSLLGTLLPKLALPPKA